MPSRRNTTGDRRGVDDFWIMLLAYAMTIVGLAASGVLWVAFHPAVGMVFFVAVCFAMSKLVLCLRRLGDPRPPAAQPVGR